LSLFVPRAALFPISTQCVKIEHSDEEDMPCLGIITRALPQQPADCDSAAALTADSDEEIDELADCMNVVVLFVVEKNSVDDAELGELWALSSAGRKMKMRTYVVEEAPLSAAAQRASAVVLMPSYLSKLQEEHAAAAASEHVTDLHGESDATVFPSLEVFELQLPIVLNRDDADLSHFATQLVPFEVLRTSGSAKVTLGFGGRRAISSVISVSPNATTLIADLRRLASSPAVGSVVECAAESAAGECVESAALTGDVAVSMEKPIQDEAARVALMPLGSLQEWWINGPLHLLKISNPVRPQSGESDAHEQRE